LRQKLLAHAKDFFRVGAAQLLGECIKSSSIDLWNTRKESQNGAVKLKTVSASVAIVSPSRRSSVG
jgi:hypothetical protein